MQYATTKNYRKGAKMEDVKTDEPEKTEKTENDAKQEAPAQEEPVIQNPVNPPLRDTQTARELRNAETKEVFRDMRRRGMIK